MMTYNENLVVLLRYDKMYFCYSLYRCRITFNIGIYLLWKNPD